LSQSLPQNPQTLGDIVGHTVRIVRGNPGLMVRALLFPSIVSCACMSLSRVIAAHWMRTASADLVYALQHIGALVLLLVLFFYYQWELIVRGLALMRFCVGYANSYKESLAYMNGRWSALAFISTLAVLLPSVVLVAAMFIALFGFLVGQFAHILWLTRIVIAVFVIIAVAGAITWSGLTGSMLLSVFACEDASVGQIIKRSEHLTLTYFWRGWSFICFVGLVLVVLSVALSVPLVVVAMVTQAFGTVSNVPNPVTVELPIYSEILVSCWLSILNLILLAVALIADVLFYQDVRVRHEGVDISERLTQLI
jgi:hypothetical protein